MVSVHISYTINIQTKPQWGLQKQFRSIKGVLRIKSLGADALGLYGLVKL